MMLLFFCIVILVLWALCERDIKRLNKALSALEQDNAQARYLLCRAEIRNTRLHNRLTAVRTAAYQSKTTGEPQ